MTEPGGLTESLDANTAKSLIVTAIIATYNEADIIARTVGDLVSQGICVYLIDTGSTDGTVTEAERFLGRGLLHIEELPLAEYAHAQLMKRKEVLARELNSDWFISADADEFRESPWMGVSLLEGIRRVDSLGYNAIDFAVLDFVPTHDDLVPGDDPREAFSYFEAAGVFNKLQIRCWKKPDGPVELASSGGHEAVLWGRKVFPIRFILRHYPFRGQTHGERKLFQERRPRYPEAEKNMGWHVQYNGISEGHCFVREIEGLERFDPELIRIGLQINNRAVEDIERNCDVLRKTAEKCAQGLAQASRERDDVRAQVRELQSAFDERGKVIIALEHQLEHTACELNEVKRSVDETKRKLDEATVARIAADRQLREVCHSASWRLTLPFRLVLGWILSVKKLPPEGKKR